MGQPYEKGLKRKLHTPALLWCEGGAPSLHVRLPKHVPPSQGSSPAMEQGAGCDAHAGEAWGGGGDCCTGAIVSESLQGTSPSLSHCHCGQCLSDQRRAFCQLGSHFASWVHIPGASLLLERKRQQPCFYVRVAQQRSSPHELQHLLHKSQGPSAFSGTCPWGMPSWFYFRGDIGEALL